MTTRGLPVRFRLIPRIPVEGTVKAYQEEVTALANAGAERILEITSMMHTRGKELISNLFALQKYKS